MKIRFKRGDGLDFLIITLLVMHVMIIRWLNLTGTFNYITICLILISLLLQYKSFMQKGQMLLFATLIIYPFINKAVCGGDYYTLASNLFETLTPILAVIYISCLMNSKREFMMWYFKQLFWPLNIYMVLNVPFILLEVAGYTQLAGFTSSVNTMKEDLISGLFGFNGTPALGLFFTFLFLYNFYYAKKFLKNSLAFHVYNYGMLAFNIAICFVNDNKGVFAAFAVYIVVMYAVYLFSAGAFNSFSAKFVKFIKKFLPAMLMGSILVYVLYRVSPLGTYIDKYIHEFNNAIIYSNSAQGSSERIGMIVYFFSDVTNKAFGNGMGVTTWTTPYAFGFKHFGQSDIGTFLINGGLLFVAIIVLIFYSSFMKAFKNKLYSIGFVLIYILMGIYTQVFTVTSFAVLCNLFFYLCWFIQQTEMDAAEGIQTIYLNH